MITIIMPAYNAELTIQKTVESILKQTYTDFKLIIIDDGSTDNTKKVIENFNDSRIQIAENKVNSGIVVSLNKGIDLASSKYIVRMDADDVMDPTRLEKQLEYMESNPDVDVMGTSAVFVNEDGKRIKSPRRPKTHKKIRTFLLFDSPIIHPSVIIRTEVLKKFMYDEAFAKVEDFELWTRVIRDHTIKNIPLKLITYTVSDNSISKTLNRNKSKKDKLMIAVYKKHLNSLGIYFDEDQLMVYRHFVSGNIDAKNHDELEKLIYLLNKIKSNLNKDEFDLNYFNYLVNAFFRRLASKNNLSYKNAKDLYSNYFSNDFKLDFVNKILMRRLN